MTHKNPLGMIKDVATASLKVPVTVAGTAVGLAKGAVDAVVGGDKDDPVHQADPRQQSDRADAAQPAEKREPQEPAAQETPEEPRVEISPDKPVNVTEELGLDPAPVEKPKTKKPLTKIDAAADAAEVDVTPADVAKNVGQSDPEKPSEQG